jgi:8-oxo-dGTP pyrophosphatase MutT (NUDIX family)
VFEKQGMEYAPDGPMPDIGLTLHPAATLVIFRRGADGGSPELLMVQRAREMRFAGGSAVFPGGRVDPADRALAARLLPCHEAELGAAKIAAIRETIEETGLVTGIREVVSADTASAARRMLAERGDLAPVLQYFGWSLMPERLTLYAHWCPLWEGGFDTRFFLTDLGTGAVDITIDATENTRLFWISAARALDMADAGEISVIFPTRRNLERLAQFADHAAALADIARHPARRIHPRQEERGGEPWIVIPDDAGYPVTGQPVATSRRG